MSTEIKTSGLEHQNDRQSGDPADCAGVVESRPAEVRPAYTDDVARARRDVFIFVYNTQLGSGQRWVRKPADNRDRLEGIRYWNGKRNHRYINREYRRIYDSPVSKMQRLGYPSRRTIFTAVKRVRAAAPELCREYKAMWKLFREARARYTATLTEKDWKQQARFRPNRGWRYKHWQLLPRLEEQQRARREVREADARMAEIKDALFDLFEVPVEFRKLVVR